MIKKIKILLVILTLFFVPKINYGQTINLGTVANFLLFTSNGAVSNSGISSFTGDIGSDLGAISGFGTAILTGTIHNTDAITSQAKTDLFIAYNQLISIPVTVTTHVSVFGSGETLTPGVYSLAGAVSLNGNLVLDAMGDSSAIFIFRFSGAYSVGINSTVILINGARSCNVFWVVEGAISIAANTIMKGTLIANNAAVSMATNGNLKGRLLSTTGAIAFIEGVANNTDPCNETPVILPIELLEFKGECSNENILLSWISATENNNNFYSIEKSMNGFNWKFVAKIDGLGNSSSINQYSYIDLETDSDILYYRLKQTDFDGKFTYSTIIDVEKCDKNLNELIVFPNPANKTLNLVFNGNDKKIISISIYNVLGDVIYFSDGFQSKILLENNLSGIYFLNAILVSKNIIKKLCITN